MRAILTYHSIDPSGSVISVDQQTFRQHVDWLSRGPVRAGTIPEVLDAQEGEDRVVLTFDDGFVNFATAAWPLLRDHGLPAILFIVTDHVGGTNDWEVSTGIRVARLPLLDWDAVARLAEEGVELGSHTHTHPRLDRLDPRRIEDELDRSAEEIRARTGIAPRAVAYPYGAVTPPVARLAAARYQYGCTTDLRELRPNESLTLLPRLDAYYFRSAGALMRWGTADQRARLWIRRCARGLRSAWRN